MAEEPLQHWSGVGVVVCGCALLLKIFSWSMNLGRFTEHYWLQA
jgi:hypothetical protein